MNYSFIQISDCHIDDEKNVWGTDSKKNLSTIVKSISNRNYNALIISGDLAHNGTASSYSTLKDIIQPISDNLVILPGNHDNKLNLFSAFSEHYLPKLTIADWEIISIDSVQENKTSGFLNKAKLELLTKKILSSTQKFIVLCLHHPPISMESDWDDKKSLENSDDFFHTIDKFSKIKAVIWGHAHQSSEFNRNNVKLFSCPSTTLQFNGAEMIGYNHFNLSDKGEINCETVWL
ncbi:metallophosphoesterase [Candidatus Thioglobus sp.]|nr:metallophosphoesterase [Candidatus Thioglobus sp.]MDA8981202.1 metallophosphoesterase [Candidatus Thioglobus sp.]